MINPLDREPIYQSDNLAIGQAIINNNSDSLLSVAKHYEKSPEALFCILKTVIVAGSVEIVGKLQNANLISESNRIEAIRQIVSRPRLFQRGIKKVLLEYLPLMKEERLASLHIALELGCEERAKTLLFSIGELTKAEHKHCLALAARSTTPKLTVLLNKYRPDEGCCIIC